MAEPLEIFVQELEAFLSQCLRHKVGYAALLGPAPGRGEARAKVTQGHLVEIVDWDVGPLR